MTRVYYKEAVGAFVVFDVTRVGTFEAVAKWKSDIDSKVCVHPLPSLRFPISHAYLPLFRCSSRAPKRRFQSFCSPIRYCDVTHGLYALFRLAYTRDVSFP